jgi:hypothetical protein
MTDGPPSSPTRCSAPCSSTETWAGTRQTPIPRRQRCSIGCASGRKRCRSSCLPIAKVRSARSRSTSQKWSKNSCGCSRGALTSRPAASSRRWRDREQILPPYARALANYSLVREHSWSAPRHQGGMAFTKLPAGRCESVALRPRRYCARWTSLLLTRSAQRRLTSPRGGTRRARA